MKAPRVLRGFKRVFCKGLAFREALQGFEGLCRDGLGFRVEGFGV